jgi:hypothetical protein
MVFDYRSTFILSFTRGLLILPLRTHPPARCSRRHVLEFFVLVIHPTRAAVHSKQTLRKASTPGLTLHSLVPCLCSVTMAPPLTDASATYMNKQCAIFGHHGERLSFHLRTQ